MRVHCYATLTDIDFRRIPRAGSTAVAAAHYSLWNKHRPHPDTAYATLRRGSHARDGGPPRPRRYLRVHRRERQQAIHEHRRRSQRLQAAEHPARACCAGAGSCVGGAAFRHRGQGVTRKAFGRAGLHVAAWRDSPTTGGDGNREFFIEARHAGAHTEPT